MYWSARSIFYALVRQIHILCTGPSDPYFMHWSARSIFYVLVRQTHILCTGTPDPYFMYCSARSIFYVLVRQIHIFCTEPTVQMFIKTHRNICIFTSFSIFEYHFNLSILTFEINSFETRIATNLIFHLQKNIY